MNETFKAFALIYLNDWYENDLHFMAKLSSNNAEDVRLRCMQKAARHYGVIRNFGDRPDETDTTRLSRALDEIGKALTDETVDDVVGRLAQQFKLDYGKQASTATSIPTEGLISAASKFLWIRHQSPIVIYDGNAFTFLKAQCSGGKLRPVYADYRKEWLRQFDERAEPIRFACAELVARKDFSFADPMPDEELMSIVKNKWFHERVFDWFLWWNGARIPTKPKPVAKAKFQTAP